MLAVIGEFIGRFGLPTFMAVWIIVIDRPKQEKRMNELIDRSCQRDAESIKDLKKNISDMIDVVSGTLIQMREDVGLHIRTDDENYERSLELLKQQNRKFDSSLDLITQTILDERVLSNTMFQMLITEIIHHNVNKTLVSMYEVFDINGFKNEQDIEVLQTNLRSIAGKYRNIARKQISELNFDKTKLNTYLKHAAVKFQEYNYNVDKVINSIDLEEVRKDRENHYRRFKQLIKNQVEIFESDLFEIIKGVLG